MLKYLLVNSPMTTDPNNCVAMVSSPENKTYGDVISKMVAEGTGLTRPQAMAYFEKLTQIIMDFVNDGHSVNTPLIRVRPTIKGLFINEDDYFDSSRHQLHIRATAGSRLREMALKIRLEKVKTAQKAPVLTTFVDGSSGERNISASPGGIGMLHGSFLYFNTSDTEQGVFFVPVGASENEVRATVYTSVKPSEIHFQIPNLSTGDYHVVVKTLSKNGKVDLSGKLRTVICA